MVGTIASCAAVLASCALAAVPAVGAPAAPALPCASAPGAAAVTARRAPLRVGITPGVQTGQLGTGPIPPRTPEVFADQVAALRALRPPGRPFVLRLHRFFWSGGEAEVRRVRSLARRYTAAGFQVELQVRYHPTAAQEGDIAAWTAHVRDIVRRIGTIRGVVGLQVTNEVNLTFSPDSSDGAYRGARDALVRGVIAAHDEARRRGLRSLTVGFNWAYRGAPADDVAFWRDLRARGGPRLRAATDWIGLDVYPGTFIPQAATPAEVGDGLVQALGVVRCLARQGGFGARIPIHLEETGWPTSATRSEAGQAAAARALLRTASAYAGTFGLTDLRWFNLRDGDSTLPGFQTRYGLVRDDGTRKPAFAVVRSLFARMAARR